MSGCQFVRVALRLRSSNLFMRDLLLLVSNNL
jgi:hypothetical protein